MKCIVYSLASVKMLPLFTHVKQIQHSVYVVCFQSLLPLLL